MASEVLSLNDLGIVRARGVDAVRFLQGQLSNDVARLAPGGSLLAGYHNPQGRAIAVLRLVRWAEDDILAILPRELAGPVAMRLGKFVLRSKVKISDDSAAWRISGVIGVPASMPSAAAVVQLSDARALVIESGEQPTPTLASDAATLAGDAATVSGNAAARETWLRMDIEGGLPQVYAATSEEFVAQMLNLDVLDAIAFDKGCYTGQEVIARAHYRGRVKRRMQRFVSREPARLAPGDSGLLADGRSFKVVLALQLPDGRCDFLAVAPLPGAEHEAAGASGTKSVPGTAGTRPLAFEQVALPYALPD